LRASGGGTIHEQLLPSVHAEDSKQKARLDAQGEGAQRARLGGALREIARYYPPSSEMGVTNLETQKMAALGGTSRSAR
jgi:hypothetical protein